MKRFGLFLLVSCCGIGCGKPSVVGIWEDNPTGNIHGKHTFSFKDDGTYTEYSNIKIDSTKAILVFEANGTYTFQDDILITNMITGKQEAQKTDTGQKDHYEYGPSTLTRKLSWFDPKKFLMYPDPKTGMGGPFPIFVKK